MTGVTILDTVEIYTLSFWQFVLGFTPMLIAVIVSFIHLWVDFKKGTKEEQEQGVINCKNHKSYELLYMAIGGILSVVLLICISKFCPADYLETHYKVKVDETASFIEFYDKYDILEEYTDYFIVKDKVD